MSLDFSLVGPEEEVVCVCCKCSNEHKTTRREVYLDQNITHNLAPMFNDAGVYRLLWCGTGERAGDHIDTLARALALMESDPARFKEHNPRNGWGNYGDALEFLRAVLNACREYPEATLECSV